MNAESQDLLCRQYGVWCRRNTDKSDQQQDQEGPGGRRPGGRRPGGRRPGGRRPGGAPVSQPALDTAGGGGWGKRRSLGTAFSVVAGRGGLKALATVKAGKKRERKGSNNKKQWGFFLALTS